MSDVSLSGTNICKSFGDRNVLKSLNIEVMAGEIVAVIGYSGCGKTTLLRCLNLLENLEKGVLKLGSQIYFRNGVTHFEEWEIRRKIGFVFQRYSLFENMTVRKNLTLGLQHSGWCNSSKLDEYALQICELLKITELFDRFPSTLSGGQLQRCALARAMVLKPKVILLDEITSALDPATTVDVIRALIKLREADFSNELAMVAVTHMLDFAEQFADRILFLHNGIIFEDLPAYGFRENSSAKSETREFVKSLKISI